MACPYSQCFLCFFLSTFRLEVWLCGLTSHLLVLFVDKRSSLLQKLADMAEIIEHREKKLLELSKQNIDMQETNNILRR